VGEETVNGRSMKGTLVIRRKVSEGKLGIKKKVRKGSLVRGKKVNDGKLGMMVSLNLV